MSLLRKDGTLCPKAGSVLTSSPSGISVKTFYEEQLSSSPVAFVPKNYEFSGDPKKKLGEEAEKEVFDVVQQAGRDFLGIQIVCFHGVRVIAGSPIILREVDFFLFITYQGRHYIVVKEVKCNANPESSRDTSKKARGQLRTFADMLGSELNVLTENIQFHAVWPNMPETEPCPSCPGRHPSLYERPEDCQQAGTQRRTNPEPAGFHLFKDTFENGEFSKWMKGIISDPAMAIDPSTYDTVLDFVARHCVGVLYDETVKSFCILGDEQAKLVNRKEQPLTKPTIVYGLAGTGKTISIMARIQHISGNLNASCKALYVCFEDNVKAMVQRKLEACQVDLDYITFANHNTFQHSFGDLSRNDKVIQDLISQGHRYIYLDSAEDLGVDWVNGLLEKTVAPTKDPNKLVPLETSGDFWITIDPYQGLNDSHYLASGYMKQVHWKGNLINSTLLKQGAKLNKIVLLEECFRMPLNMIKHIEAEKVLPTSDLPRAKDVRSRGVVLENINLPAGYHLQSLAEELADQLYEKVMITGVHPGHCAVVYNDGAVDDIFPPNQGGFLTFVKTMNSSLKGLSVKGQASHMLQVTQDINESLLYKRSQCNTSSAHPLPFTISPRSIALNSAEETVEYNMERHGEVTLKIFTLTNLVELLI